MNKICRKLKTRYKFKYDINAILSDLIYARGLEPVHGWRRNPSSILSLSREFKRAEIPETAGTESYREFGCQKFIYCSNAGLYSPKYARCQKTIREKQVERAEKMIASGNTKKQRKNPNDPRRFIGTVAVTDDGEKAKVHSFLDENKIEDEAIYDGLYAVCTDLLDDDVSEILKVSEGRWQIEECFRIMKTDFAARPVYLQDESRIKAHFLICFLAFLCKALHNNAIHKKMDDKKANTMPDCR